MTKRTWEYLKKDELGNLVYLYEGDHLVGIFMKTPPNKAIEEKKKVSKKLMKWLGMDWLE